MFQAEKHKKSQAQWFLDAFHFKSFVDIFLIFLRFTNILKFFRTFKFRDDWQPWHHWSIWSTPVCLISSQIPGNYSGMPLFAKQNQPWPLEGEEARWDMGWFLLWNSKLLTPVSKIMGVDRDRWQQIPGAIPRVTGQRQFIRRYNNLLHISSI